VVEALLQRRDDLGRGGKIHVGYPEWQDVVAFILVPF